MDNVTTETPNEAPAPVINEDPVPANVRAFMNEHRGEDFNGVLNYIRSSEGDKQRRELEDAKSEKTRLEAQLEELKKKETKASGDKTKQIESETEDLKSTVRELRDIVLKSVEANQQASIGTRRMVLLAQISPEILPVELHSMVNGGTDEELQTSLSNAINIYRTIASRFVPVEQQQAQPGMIPQVPMGLNSPQNAGLNTEITSEPITAGTIRELASRAMGGDREALAQFQQAAGQVVATRGMG